MRRAIYPGSFDPVTNGHLDIIERGCKLFDEIIIAILVNPDKQPFFSIEERRGMLEEVLKTIERRSCTLRVDAFEGLLVHYALAQVFMMPAETYSYVSSRLVKEVFQLGGELDGLVPTLVNTRMKEKVKG